MNSFPAKAHHMWCTQNWRNKPINNVIGWGLWQVFFKTSLTCVVQPTLLSRSLDSSCKPKGEEYIIWQVPNTHRHKHTYTLHVCVQLFHVLRNSKKNKSSLKCPKFLAQLPSSGDYFLQLMYTKTLFTQWFSNVWVYKPWWSIKV